MQWHENTPECDAKYNARLAEAEGLVPADNWQQTVVDAELNFYRETAFIDLGKSAKRDRYIIQGEQWTYPWVMDVLRATLHHRLRGRIQLLRLCKDNPMLREIAITDGDSVLDLIEQQEEFPAFDEDE